MLLPLLFAACGDPVAVVDYLTVINVAPSHGAANIGTETTVLATFNDDLVEGSWNGAVYLEDPAGSPVVASLDYDTSTRTLVLAPTEPLERATTYGFVLTETLEGERYGALPGEIRTSFSTLGSAGGGAANQAPVAGIGVPDVRCHVGEPFAITADATDPDGDALTYAWRVVNGPGEVETEGDDTTMFTFTVLVEGDYTFGLVVNDGELDSSEAFATLDCGMDSGF